jgi:hypothetical protein
VDVSLILCWLWRVVEVARMFPRIVDEDELAKTGEASFAT